MNYDYDTVELSGKTFPQVMEPLLSKVTYELSLVFLPENCEPPTVPSPGAATAARRLWRC